MSVLNEPVLVLNKGWMPLEACTVRKAFTKVFADNAKIIDPSDCQTYDFESWIKLPLRDGDKMITTYMSGFRAPEVIVLASDGKPGRRRNKIAFSRRNLIRRDGNTCQYCGDHSSGVELTVDHVFPQSRGGQSIWINCVAACLPCNFKKGNRTPEEANMELLTKPYEPKWSPIFRISTLKYKESWKQFLPEVQFVG